MVKKILCLVLLIFIAGCGTVPDKPVVTKTKTIVVTTPSPLLRDCKIDAPPAIDDYMSADMSGREDMMATYSTQLLKNLKNCNDQIDSITKFQDEQVKLYQK